jgi:hypothetical protein
MLHLPAAAQASLVAGARDLEPVRGLTHGFYKYPARFSPSFARAAIETFTQPFEWTVKLRYRCAICRRPTGTRRVRTDLETSAFYP